MEDMLFQCPDGLKLIYRKMYASCNGTEMWMLPYFELIKILDWLLRINLFNTLVLTVSFYIFILLWNFIFTSI